jgi:hypothetical protein
MTREELEADYQRMKKQSQLDYKDLFGSEAPSLKKIIMKRKIKKIKDIATRIVLTILFFGILIAIPAIVIAAVYYNNYIPLIAVVSIFSLIAIGSIVWAGISFIWDID